MNPVDFPPRRSRGVTFHGTLIVALIAVGVVFGVLASRRPVDALFAAYIAGVVLAFFLVFFVAYRLYALRRANYSLDREKLTIAWGWRVEQISIADIEWVRPLSALSGPVSLPLFSLPGIVVGVRRQPDLGQVEFMASDKDSLLLVATSRRIFAISPESAADFLQNIRRVMEMGSLVPTLSQSQYPSSIVAQAWRSPLARFLWLAGLFLNIGLLGWVGFLLPSLGPVSLGFLPSTAVRTPVAGLSVILLPVISVFSYLIGWVVGLIIYRREDQRAMAHVIWAGGVVSTVLFLLAVMLIITTPV